MELEESSNVSVSSFTLTESESVLNDVSSSSADTSVDLEDDEEETSVGFVITDDRFSSYGETIENLQNDLSQNEEITQSRYENIERLLTEASEKDTLSSSSVAVPDDYYTYTADVFGQMIFFQSLICGLLLFLIFSKNFK